MGVLDKVTDTLSSLIPSRRHRQEARHELPPVGAEVLALRDSLDRWLGRFYEEPWGLPSAGDFSNLVPSTSVRETDKEFIVNVEVPGLDKSDLELTIDRNNLIIRGERREDKEDNRGAVRMSEHQYGRFVQTVPLPDDIDVERGEARMGRGVLTISFPKLGRRAEGRRIPVST